MCRFERNRAGRQRRYGGACARLSKGAAECDGAVVARCYTAPCSFSGSTHPLIEAGLERQLAASRPTTSRDDAASALRAPPQDTRREQPSMRVVLSSRRTCTCTELPRAMAARALLLRRFRPRVHNQTRGCDRGGSSLSPPTPSGNGALPSIRARRSRLTAAGTPYPAYAHRAAEPEDGTPSQNRGSQNRGSPGALVPGPPVVPRARPPSVSHPRPSLPPICPPSAFASLP